MRSPVRDGVCLLLLVDVGVQIDHGYSSFGTEDGTTIADVKTSSGSQPKTIIRKRDCEEGLDSPECILAVFQKGELVTLPLQGLLLRSFSALRTPGCRLLILFMFSFLILVTIGTQLLN